MIVIPLTFRSITFISLAIMITSILHVRFNSKQKEEYDYVQGRITYLDQEMGDLPSRDKGKYRYLIVDTYPFPFEIYADDQANKIDNLNIGDQVSIFFYETRYTKSDRVNRYIQYLEKEGMVYFKRDNLQKITGYILITISLLLIIFAFALWKSKKINY
jgi:hypothetical protein